MKLLECVKNFQINNAITNLIIMSSFTKTYKIVDKEQNRKEIQICNMDNCFWQDNYWYFLETEEKEYKNKPFFRNLQALFDNYWYKLQAEEKEWASNWMYIGNKIDAEYYFINNRMQTICKWDANIQEGLSFETRGKAQKFIAKLEASKSIWKWKTENDWDFNPDWENNNEEKYCICYIWEIWKLNNDTSRYLHIPFIPYYSSNEISIRAINELEEEYLLLLTK